MRKILVFKNIAKFFFILVVVILFVFPSCKVSKISHLSNIDSTNIVKQPESLVDTDYYLTVQRMPEFQGGDINTFISYLQKQIKYPKAALTKKKQGLTAIQIGIDCFGAVHALAILKSSGSNLLDNEARRAILTSPKWNPAKLDNKAVGKLYVLQFRFNATTKKIEIKQ